MAFYFAKAFEDLAASTDSSAFLGGVRNVAYSFMILGSIILVSMTLQSMLMETAAGEMTREMKNAWFRALLRQDMAYYDIRDVPGQATLISSNGSKFRKGVGRKLSEAVQFFVACLGALAYSFYASWQVTLALAAIAPFLFLSTFYIVKITTTQVCWGVCLALGVVRDHGLDCQLKALFPTHPLLFLFFGRRPGPTRATPRRGR